MNIVDEVLGLLHQKSANTENVHAMKDGKPFGTSKGSYLADFKTLTVENDYSSLAGGNAAGKSSPGSASSARSVTIRARCDQNSC